MTELSGDALDEAVAAIEGHKRQGTAWVFANGMGSMHYSPSTSWAQGGPIIERERIEIHPRTDRGVEEWGALPNLASENDRWAAMQYGPTPLIAAMRCYVASRACLAAAPEG